MQPRNDLDSLLHLTGAKAVSKDYETLGEPSVPLEAFKRFRQLDSRCPGHPEYRFTTEHVVAAAKEQLRLSRR